MAVHLGNPDSNRYPRPLRCGYCGDEWIHTPHDHERFTFVLWARVGCCRRCIDANEHYKQAAIAGGLVGVQLEMELATV
jgi:hypothetical protein